MTGFSLEQNRGQCLVLLNKAEQTVQQQTIMVTITTMIMIMAMVTSIYK